MFSSNLPLNRRGKPALAAKDEMRWKAGNLGHLGGILESNASAGAAEAVVRTAAQMGSLSSRPGWMVLISPYGS